MKKLLVLSMILMSGIASATNIHLDLDLQAMGGIQKESVGARRDHDFTSVLFKKLIKKNIYVVEEVQHADYIVEGEAISLTASPNEIINPMCGKAKYQIQARIYNAKTRALVGLAKASATGYTECAVDAFYEGSAERKALSGFYKKLEKELSRVAQ